MPMLMLLERSLGAGRLGRRLGSPPVSRSASFNTRQTLAGLTATTSASSIMNVSCRQPSHGFFQVEIDHRFSFPYLQPEIAGNPTVVLVGTSEALPTLIELAGGLTQPMNPAAAAQRDGRIMS
jgi:hypothetical protein